MGEAERPLDADGRMGQMRCTCGFRSPHRQGMLRGPRPFVQYGYYGLRTGLPTGQPRRYVHYTAVLLGAGGYAGASRPA